MLNKIAKRIFITRKVITNAFSEVRAIKKLDDINGLERHPLTNIEFKEFKIPDFDNAKKLALEIVNKINFHDRKLFGLDICFSNKGPMLIKVNASRPGMPDLWQTPLKNIPLRLIFKRMLI